MNQPNLPSNLCKFAWERKYWDAVNSDASISCKTCGNTLIGDGPAIEIECLNCFSADFENRMANLDKLSALDEELGLQ